MKSDRPYPFVTIDARGAKRAQQGHPWVFDNEITAQEGALEDGALCDVRSPKGRYLGTGTYNSHSKIRVRLLSQNANDKFDQAFFPPGGPSMPGTTAKPSWARTWTAAASSLGRPTASPG